jgi:hypothetical protein
VAPGSAPRRTAPHRTVVAVEHVQRATGRRGLLLKALEEVEEAQLMVPAVQDVTHLRLRGGRGGIAGGEGCFGLWRGGRSVVEEESALSLGVRSAKAAAVGRSARRRRLTAAGRTARSPRTWTHTVLPPAQLPASSVSPARRNARRAFSKSPCKSPIATRRSGAGSRSGSGPARAASAGAAGAAPVKAQSTTWSTKSRNIWLGRGGTRQGKGEGLGGAGRAGAARRAGRGGRRPAFGSFADRRQGGSSLGATSAMAMARTGYDIAAAMHRSSQARPAGSDAPAVHLRKRAVAELAAAAAAAAAR